MLIKKTTKTQEQQRYVPPKYIRTYPKLKQWFLDEQRGIREGPEEELGEIILQYLHGLVYRTELSELLHFARLHDQMLLYRTLREFVRMSLPQIRGDAKWKEEILELAAQILTQAYCIYHEPNTLGFRTGAKYAYPLSLELSRILRPVEALTRVQGPERWYLSNTPDSEED